MTKKLERFAPPGFAVQREFGIYVFACAVPVACMIKFIFTYFISLMYMYRDIASHMQYGPNEIKMSYFYTFVVDFTMPILIFSAVFFAYVAAHYIYFIGNRSIYLMRRLPDRSELHKRCWCLPLVGLAFYIITVTAVFFICYALYMLVTPNQYLEPGQLEQLWRVLKNA